MRKTARNLRKLYFSNVIVTPFLRRLIPLESCHSFSSISCFFSLRFLLLLPITSLRMQSFDGIELGSLERGQYARDRAYYHAQRQPEEVIAYS